ncbi:MAG TPA: ParB/RepB/Spo0J family partition protein [Syntrophales bacterium]|nr:ParB/RepB/Spo0J family partition protein [Syntrophales bacterium]HOH73673.1 ParB/RepB/Spo0J family partition protein [Syntrophales bacterium]HPN09125.1 ParB/RepB/Spo0J family partition protein [Syntrophales bacterium]HPX80636.1 ParB/RepB/Spo0J family partition protein [Syntrophales bacterium]HQB13656.1 ParB/RepB/Spo0J family partition protein [Syntrophales bacterium]
MAAKYVKGRLYKLKIAELQADPEQPRKFMDPIALNELTASIQKFGVLVPIQFRQDEAGALIIVSGHRRVQAAGRAGRTEISGTYTEGDTRLQGFVENLQRENMLPIDEAEQMQSLMKEYALNQYQLAEAIGKSQPAVNASLSLNKLPEDIRDSIRTNPNITKTMLLDVVKMKTEKSMRRKFEGLMARGGQKASQAVRKEKVTKQRAFLNRTDALTSEIASLPWSEWSEDDRIDLANALRGLRQSAGALLTAMDEPRDAEEEEQERPASMNLS